MMKKSILLFFLFFAVYNLNYAQNNYSYENDYNVTAKGNTDQTPKSIFGLKYKLLNRLSSETANIPPPSSSKVKWSPTTGSISAIIFGIGSIIWAQDMPDESSKIGLSIGGAGMAIYGIIASFDWGEG